MSNIVEYKGYWAQVEYSAKDCVLFGKIEGINDLVNFECKDADGVETAFQEAVDDYLAFCADIGQAPEKAYKGSFNVRIPTSLHREADMERIKRNCSLNQIIIDALESYLHPAIGEIRTTLVLPESVFREKEKIERAYKSADVISLFENRSEVSYG